MFDADVVFDAVDVITGVGIAIGFDTDVDAFIEADLDAVVDVDADIDVVGVMRALQFSRLCSCCIAAVDSCALAVLSV